MSRLIAAALILSAAGALPAGAARGEAQAPDRFDGTWSVEITTDSGSCDRSYRYPVRIERGQARFVGLPLAIQGGVARNGALKGSIAAGASTASVVGRLNTNGSGTGTWVATGSLECRGRWSAERQG